MTIKKNKHAQITIMVILALIIIVSVALVTLAFKKQTPVISGIENPSGYIEQCAKQSIEKNVNLLIEENGYPNKTDNYIVYLGKKVPYLCKSGTFYTPCINQEPLLIEHFRILIENQTKKEVQKCFDDLTKNFINKGYSVEGGKNGDYNIRFQTDSVIMDMDNKITIKKGEETKVYEKFYAQTTSPLYRLVSTARHIVNFESTLCNFDYLTWEQYYRSISIK